MAKEKSVTNGTILTRLKTIEDSLFHDSNSLLVRIARVEDKLDRLEQSIREKAYVDEKRLTNELLNKLNAKYDIQIEQLRMSTEELRKNGKTAFWGLVITITLTLLTGILGKAMGWF
jgi:hypothetical protein